MHISPPKLCSDPATGRALARACNLTASTEIYLYHSSLEAREVNRKWELVRLTPLRRQVWLHIAGACPGHGAIWAKGSWTPLTEQCRDWATENNWVLSLLDSPVKAGVSYSLFICSPDSLNMMAEHSARRGKVGSTVHLRNCMICLHNFILVTIYIVSTDKTAWFLFCIIPVPFAPHWCWKFCFGNTLDQDLETCDFCELYRDAQMGGCREFYVSSDIFVLLHM